MLFELVKIVSQNNMIYIHVDSPGGAIKGEHWVWRRGQAWVANYTRPLPWWRWYSGAWRLCRDEVHQLAGYWSCSWCCKLFCWISILLILWLLIFKNCAACATSSTLSFRISGLLFCSRRLVLCSEWHLAKAQTSIVLMMSANQQYQVAGKLI